MKISIITITFNSEATLEETIQSVISQGYDDIEYIIVDGASKDGTLDIVNKYRDYITTFISEPDEGICDAFNKGINAATGDIIGIINSDDMLVPGALKCISLNIKPDTDVFYGDGLRLFSDGHTELYKAKDLKLLKQQMALVHPSTFVRKSAYVKHGLFDPNYRVCMDRELLLRMFVNKAKFQYYNQVLSVYRMGGMSDKTFFTTVKRERELISRIYGEPLIKYKIFSIIGAVKGKVKSFLKK